METNCKYCGKPLVEVKKITSGKFCSYSCYEHWSKENKEPNCQCAICGKEMYLKPSRIKRAEHGITCSKECGYKLKSQYMAGGEKSSVWINWRQKFLL